MPFSLAEIIHLCNLFTWIKICHHIYSIASVHIARAVIPDSTVYMPSVVIEKEGRGFLCS